MYSFLILSILVTPKEKPQYLHLHVQLKLAQCHCHYAIPFASANILFSHIISIFEWWQLTLLGTGLRSSGFLVEAQLQTKHWRCSGSSGRCQNIFRATEVPLSKVQNPQMLIWGPSMYALCLHLYVPPPNDPKMGLFSTHFNLLTWVLQLFFNYPALLRLNT